MNGREKPYIPGLDFRWLTPPYDPALHWLMREEGIMHSLVYRMALRPGMLDLGRGTGTLAIMIKQLHSEIEGTVLDTEPDVLPIARQTSFPSVVR